MLCGCETWKVTSRITNKLEIFVKGSLIIIIIIITIIDIKLSKMISYNNPWKAVGDKTIILQTRV